MAIKEQKTCQNYPFLITLHCIFVPLQPQFRNFFLESYTAQKYFPHIIWPMKNLKNLKKRKCSWRKKQKKFVKKRRNHLQMYMALSQCSRRYWPGLVTNSIPFRQLFPIKDHCKRVYCFLQNQDKGLCQLFERCLCFNLVPKSSSLGETKDCESVKGLVSSKRPSREKWNRPKEPKEKIILHNEWTLAYPLGKAMIFYKTANTIKLR